ncbi:Uu.00g116310.m01.CDS01 [Anthostomella pinea]|uniref:Uu.00g116310.m01.CDS01 n=1 Tax=Anthostomella pinea TaxID=933095 RepID=A0AAI8VAT0_9PEZI|nr:Uu.00g116310.m01.CDS01 [Anthostomella pinea]
MRIPGLEYTARALSLSTGSQRPLSDDPFRGVSDTRFLSRPELPGGTPLSLCEVSRPTDLYNITSVEVTQQPIHFDDFFLFHLYGTFQGTFTPNATITFSVDCGSHCEDYGYPPGETSPYEAWTEGFCTLTDIQQPLGGLPKRNTTCPPVEGFALLESPGYVMPMFFRRPGFFNFTFDAKTAEGGRIYCLTAEVCLRWEDEEINKRYKGPMTNCTWPR